MFSIVAFTLASALAASAAEFTVAVGANNMLAFDPPSVMAQPGDMIHFEFQNKNHSVTQSTFASPCSKSTSGVDSGFMLVDAAATSHPIWTLQISDTTPLWFYCAQTNPVPHCAAGMVFAVNPTADKTFDQFQTAAKAGGSGNSTTEAPGSNSVIPAPTALPTAGGAGAGTSASVSAGTGASVSVGAGGFTTSVSNAAATGTNSAAGAATTSANPNSAVGLSSAGAVSLVSIFAAVAGFML
ncbi:hypothetical protein D9756_001302 [Leucocoprinus leucothites]|uniref:Cupredoxin n=1 Tax=Leucocoprinus leucothites TaxID=201217 RepID=A0A8H5G5C9_9AGAR|nr:hypothetical protein D9756_001302 [Leucoagaricus leucothites]